MICANCGEGTILKSKPCERCGIGYEEMIGNIQHDEMKSLIEKMDGMISRHENIDIEASIMACELLNAHFLIPAKVENEELFIRGLNNPRGKSFIMLFTDKAEYDKADIGMDPVTNPFLICLELLDSQFEGFVINPKGRACELSRKFLERYFGDHIVKS